MKNRISFYACLILIGYLAAGKEMDRRWYEDDGKPGYPPED